MQSNKKIMNKRNESLRKSDLFIDSLRRQNPCLVSFSPCLFLSNKVSIAHALSPNNRQSAYNAPSPHDVFNRKNLKITKQRTKNGITFVRRQRKK